MKIQLELSTEQVIYLNGILNGFVDSRKSLWATMSCKEKAAYTIAVDVADKLHAKARSASRKMNTDRLSKVSFKYHEAYGINYFVCALKDREEDIYYRSIALGIYIQLDQKLS